MSPLPRLLLGVIALGIRALAGLGRRAREEREENARWRQWDSDAGWGRQDSPWLGRRRSSADSADSADSASSPERSPVWRDAPRHIDTGRGRSEGGISPRQEAPPPNRRTRRYHLVVPLAQNQIARALRPLRAEIVTGNITGMTFAAEPGGSVIDVMIDHAPGAAVDEVALESSFARIDTALRNGYRIT